MSRGLPSMTALLGLLAVAGYQNKDKIAEMLGGLGGGAAGRPTGPGGLGSQGAPSGQAGGFGNLGGLFGGLAGGSAGGLLSGGLGQLIDQFKQAGQGETVDSWVSPGPNKPVEPQQLQTAIGPDVLATLSQQTGLSKDELLARLSRELPKAVDQYTPDGRLPNPDHA